ncbi:MAG: D-alanyl-D-alanine carboxypeptidase family protein [Myxococcales bacterium]|nr:D-alanyl-D-alanine carboxypeptidase family protein [Myxococcales bacterium]
MRGEPFPITVVTADGKPVERETANAYWVMQQAAAADGVAIRIVSGFRTNAEQQRLYNCYVNCNCNNCNLAARPGFSNHQSGHALDLNTSAGGVLGWLNRNGARFGFSRTVPSEDWHWEWWGGGPGGGVCLDAPCAVIGAGGETLDDSGPCFQANGPAQFWRREDGIGHGGGLRWTNVWTSAEPSNWARWQLNFEQAGFYEVAISTGGMADAWTSVRYRVRHAGQSSTVHIDQSREGNWLNLGTFRFAADGDQYVDVFDNNEGAVPANRHIVADAVRIRPAPCAAVPAEGGVVDERGPCFRAYGPEATWRTVTGQGQGGSLMWTNAFSSADPANWARWTLDLAEAGDYEVEVRTGGEFGVFARTRYAVRHDGESTPIQVDQSAVDGWQSIGIFTFAAGADQSVDLFDNAAGNVPADQHILADAVRLTRVVVEPGPMDPEGADDGEGAIEVDAGLEETPVEEPPVEEMPDAEPMPTAVDAEWAAPEGEVDAEVAPDAALVPADLPAPAPCGVDGGACEESADIPPPPGSAALQGEPLACAATPGYRGAPALLGVLIAVSVFIRRRR